jgi:hypothetical protein
MSIILRVDGLLGNMNGTVYGGQVTLVLPATKSRIISSVGIDTYSIPILRTTGNVSLGSVDILMNETGTVYLLKSTYQPTTVADFLNYSNADLKSFLIDNTNVGSLDPTDPTGTKVRGKATALNLSGLTAGSYQLWSVDTTYTTSAGNITGGNLSHDAVHSFTIL